MLQKIVNGIAIASGVVSLTVIGLGGYVFIRKDAIIENVKSKVMESVLPSGLGTGALEGISGGLSYLHRPIQWQHLLNLQHQNQPYHSDFKD